MSTHINLNPSKTSAAITFDYDPNVVSEVKLIPGRRFDGSTKTWNVPLESPAAKVALKRFADHHGVALDLDDENNTLTLPDVTSVEVEGTAAESLRAHQAQFVAAVQDGNRALLLADEPGMGKSASALVGAVAAGASRVLIVSPAVMKRTWTREIAQFVSPDASVAVLSGRKADAGALTDAQFVVINYEIADAWAETLTAWAPEALIVDEAHYAKNYRAKRTKAVLEIARTVRARKGAVFALTGTPIPNKPIDLYAVLDLLGVAGAFGGWMDFAKYYCGAYQGAYGLQFGDPKHLDDLHQQLSDTVLVRRRKSEVLDLPSRTVADVPVDLDAAGRRSVKAATSALVTSIQAAIAIAQQSDDEPVAIDRAYVRRIVAQQLRPGATGDAAGALATLRREIGAAKSALIARQAADLIEQGEQVVVMVHHREVQDAVRTALVEQGYSVGSITGGQDDAARQRDIERFQAGDLQVIVASIKAAGVGITLHAASNLVLGELPWTAADQDQAIDRIHRIGQDAPVTAWRVLATGTLDDRMADLISKKGNWSREAIDGGAHERGSREVSQVDGLTDLVCAELGLTA